MARDHDHYRRRLLTLRAEVRAAADGGEAWSATVELDQSRVGRLSRVDAMQAQAMSQASGRRRRGLLMRIDAALERLADGEYGLCRGCGEPIDPRRLDIDPAVVECVRCAENAR